MSAEPKPAAELSAIDSQGIGVRVRFFWQGDRYGHRIEAVDGHRMRTLLESLEGDEAAAWPASPPLQQVNISRIVSDTEQGHVAMLVGAAGKSHWSMCVAVRGGVFKPREDQSASTELFFDVACRSADLPEWLGSTYRSMVGPVAISDRLNCAFVPAEAPGCVVMPQGVQLEMDTKSAAMPILRCAATEIELSESPATVRWRYAVRRSSGGPFRRAGTSVRR